MHLVSKNTFVLLQNACHWHVHITCTMFIHFPLLVKSQKPTGVDSYTHSLTPPSTNTQTTCRCDRRIVMGTKMLHYRFPPLVRSTATVLFFLALPPDECLPTVAYKPSTDAWNKRSWLAPTHPTRHHCQRTNFTSHPTLSFRQYNKNYRPS